MSTQSATKKFITSKAGFTMAEVLVSTLILAFLVAAISVTVLVGNFSWITNSAEVELQQELRQAMLWMKQDIQQTGPASLGASVPLNSERDAITYPNPDDDPAFDWNSYTTISFQTVTGATNGVKTWSSDTTTYYRESNASDPDYNTLTRTVGSTTQLIAENISSIQARRLYDSPHVLEVALEASRGTLAGAQGRTITLTLNFKIQMRN